VLGRGTRFERGIARSSSLYIDAHASPWPIYRHRRNLIALDINKIPQDRIHVPPQFILGSAHNHKTAHLLAARVSQAGVSMHDYDIDFDATQHLADSMPVSISINEPHGIAEFNGHSSH